MTDGREGIASRRGRALGTGFVLAITERRDLDVATRLLQIELDAIDAAASRFRPDSEVLRLKEAGGEPVRVSPLLLSAIEVALFAAEQTAGAVDPTVGDALVALGYDRDFDAVEKTNPESPQPSSPATGWRSIGVDRSRGEVRVPEGVLLDLGSTAKAFTADRAARVIAEATGAGVLVGLGGDIAVAGEAPEAGWPIGVAPASNDDTSSLRQSVSIRCGGLATSSFRARTWTRGGRVLHHIIDPASGECALEYWRLVTVAASSCVTANTFSTAALVWGKDAPDRMAPHPLHARLEDQKGNIVRLHGWPAPSGALTTVQEPRSFVVAGP